MLVIFFLEFLNPIVRVLNIRSACSLVNIWRENLTGKGKKGKKGLYLTSCIPQPKNNEHVNIWSISHDYLWHNVYFPKKVFMSQTKSYTSGKEILWSQEFVRKN